MLGLKKRDIKKALKAGAKAGGVSLADVRANIESESLKTFGSLYFAISIILRSSEKIEISQANFRPLAIDGSKSNALFDWPLKSSVSLFGPPSRIRELSSSVIC